MGKTNIRHELDKFLKEQIVPDIRYSHPGGERCENCGKLSKLCWKAPDKIWEQVIGERINLCIPCFDIIASFKGVALTWECGEHPIYLKRKIKH